MIITCEKCDTSFNLDESLLKQTGSKVRCSKCKHTFLAYPLMTAEKPDQPLETTPGLESGKKTEAFGFDQKQGKPVGEDLFQEKPEEGMAAPESDSKFDDGLEKQETGFEDLDLSELDELLEAEEKPESKESFDIKAEDPDLEMDMQSESDIEPVAVGPKSEFEEEDIALSDMEKLIEADDEPGTGEASGTDEEGLDLDLEDFDLTDLEPIPETEEEPKAEEDLGTELEELDLSEIDKMLEADDESRTGEASGTDEEDLELEPEDFDLTDLERMLETEEEPEAKKTGETEPEDLDLSDIDKMLETEEESGSGEKHETEIEELELEFNLEEGAGDKEEDAGTTSPNDISELDLSETDETEKSEAEKNSEAEDMELEFQLEDSEPESDSKGVLDEPLPEDETVAVASDAGSEVETGRSSTGKAQEETAEAGTPTAAVADAKTRSAGKKRAGKTVLVFGVIVILLAGAFGALLFFQNKGVEIPYIKNINIPFVSDWLKPGAQDIGNLKMRTLEISSRFMENSQNGKLFIITGKVRNDYSDARSTVKVAGKLYSKGKNIIRTETVYCGNVLSDLELTAMKLEAIKKRLSNPANERGTDMSVQSGKIIPFMIVFSELPDDLEEFTIEVLESSPFKK